MSETLLLFPGLLNDSRLWRDQIVALEDRVRPVVADFSLDDSLEGMVARVLGAVEGRFALAGLSMGGYAALTLMRLAPQRVTRLALFDTSARPDSAEQNRRRRGLLAMAGRSRFKGVTTRLLPHLLHPARLSEPVLCQDIVEMGQRVGREAFIRQERAILGRPDLRPVLPSIGVPTLVAVGEADVLTPLDHAEEMAEAIPGAMLRIIPDAGHLPPMETPLTVNELLRAWLDGALW